MSSEKCRTFCLGPNVFKLANQLGWTVSAFKASYFEQAWTSNIFIFHVHLPMKLRP